MNYGTVKLEGVWDFELRNPDGQVVKKWRVHNLVVTIGKAKVAGLINGVGAVPFKYIAIGTGGTAPAAGDTALQAEITTNGGARLLATVSNVTTTLANDTARFVCTFQFTGSFAVLEAGIFNASVAGQMLSRVTFAVANVIAGQSLLVQGDVKVA